MRIVKSCIICSSDNMKILLDLGDQPLANALLEDASQQALLYPLVLSQCKRCLHGQISTQLEPSLLFSSNYPFLAGQSVSWLKHCKEIANMLVDYHEDLHSYESERRMIIDIGSNDGTLLYALENTLGDGYTFLGVDPSDMVVNYSRLQVMWEEAIINPGSASLITATNVLAHTPTPHIFLSVVYYALAKNGIFYVEVPDLNEMIIHAEFSSIYHEHYSYFTLSSLISLLSSHELWPIKIIESPMHGGSIGIVCSKNPQLLMAGGCPPMQLLPDFSNEFSEAVETSIDDLYDKLISTAKQPLYGYGASAKATVLLNYMNNMITKSTLLPLHRLLHGVFDSAPTKIGRYIPGVNLPILSPEDIPKLKPATILILSPNISEDLISQAKKFGFEGDFLFI